MCSQVLKYAKRGDFEKCCEFRKNCSDGTKFQNSGTPAREGLRRADSSFYAASCQRVAGAKSNACARNPKALERVFEASLADAQLEPAASVDVRAAHLRSRIPAMALT